MGRTLNLFAGMMVGIVGPHPLVFSLWWLQFFLTQGPFFEKIAEGFYLSRIFSFFSEWFADLTGRG